MGLRSTSRYRHHFFLFVAACSPNFLPGPLMTESNLRTILNAVDAALKVYDLNEGKLTALEISLKSMLKAVRARVTDELFNATQIKGE